MGGIFNGEQLIMQDSILFRADASPAIGTGHLLRSLALAEECKKNSLEPVFVLSMETPLSERIKEEGMEVIKISAERGSVDDVEQSASVALKKGAAWIVADGYAFGPDFQKVIRDAGLKLLLIDDYAHLDSYNCDILLNQNIDAVESQYSNKTDAKLLLGTDYALLRQEFLEFKDYERKIPEKAKKLLITLGGTDTFDVLKKILRALSLIKDYQLEIDLVIGGTPDWCVEIESLAKESPHKISVVQNVTDMPERMARADFAVAAGGSTSWELLFMGLPFITGILAENQERIATELGNRSLALNFGWYKDCAEEMISEKINHMVCDVDLRVRISGKGKSVVDGGGPNRVIDEMQMLVG